jgi:hypothetical protein
VFIWFAAASVVLTFVVFRSPALDYRLIALGAVLPVVEVPFGAGPLHSLLAPTLALVVVVLLTRGRRLVRRQWLGLPIGMYLHLVLDFGFSSARTFWWPLLGWSFSTGDAPEVGRGAWSLLLEVAGIGLAAWAWQRFGLDDRDRRHKFLHTGQLDRAVVGPEGTGS